MENLTVLDFAGKNIRFERRDDRVWVSLTDIAIATGKQVGHWTRLDSATEYLIKFEYVLRMGAMEIMQGGIPELQGAWAIEEVAIKFAAWCNVELEIWVIQQVRTLTVERTVSISPNLDELAKQLEIQKDLILAEFTESLESLRDRAVVRMFESSSEIVEHFLREQQSQRGSKETNNLATLITLSQVKLFLKYKTVISRLLEVAGDQFANHACNDLDLENLLPDIKDRQELARLIAEKNKELDSFNPDDGFENAADFPLMLFFAEIFRD